MVLIRDKKTGEGLYHQPPYTPEEEDRLYAQMNGPPPGFIGPVRPMRFMSRSHPPGYQKLAAAAQRRMRQARSPSRSRRATE